MNRWLALLAAGACACSGASDVDTDTLAAPDITGHYEMQILGSNGCDARGDLVEGWAGGPLVVTGDANALTYDFGDGATLDGSVGDDYGFQGGGVVTYTDDQSVTWTLSSFMSGSVYTEDDRWVLDGDYTVTADDDGIESNDCEITGPLKAYQLAG